MINSMKYSKSKPHVFKTLILFVIEAIIIIVCCLIEFSILRNVNNITASKTLLLTGISIIIILLSSFILLLFIKQLSYDKKILIALGFVAIALGILGYSDLIIKNNLSIIDALYRTFQLFVGEFNDIPHEPGKFPIMLNISRFLALFVTFGTIAILLLREKITQLNIRFFYHDVVIITNEIDKTITSLAGKLNDSERKVIIGLLKPTQDAHIRSNEHIPIIEFDIEKTLEKGLNYCNISKTRCIYLLCTNTSDNIVLYKAIQLICGLPKQKLLSENPIEPDNLNCSTDELIDNFHEALHKGFTRIEQTDCKKKFIKKCFIKYNTTAEKEFFSNDSSLINESNLETYFINPYSNALRQMISRIDLWNLINNHLPTKMASICDALGSINIGISGSGPLLESTIEEIIHLGTFGISTKPEFHFIGSNSYPKSILSESTKSTFDKVLTSSFLDIDSLPANPTPIDLLFICSENEILIKLILHKLFQTNFHLNLKEVIILTENNGIEYSLLKKYIVNLADHCLIYDEKPRSNITNIYFSNTSDLLMSIDEFYNLFGPDIRHVHDSYRRSISNGTLEDFKKLPELLIESNLLASIRNQLILDMLKNAVKSICEKTFVSKESLIEIFWYLAQSEHERWYMERLIHGYILAECHDYLLNKNPNLKHWSQLTPAMKEENFAYLLNTLFNQLKKHKPDESAEYISSLISTISINFEGKKDKQ